MVWCCWTRLAHFHLVLDKVLINNSLNRFFLGSKQSSRSSFSFSLIVIAFTGYSYLCVASNTTLLSCFYSLPLPPVYVDNEGLDNSSLCCKVASLAGPWLHCLLHFSERDRAIILPFPHWLYMNVELWWMLSVTESVYLNLRITHLCFLKNFVIGWFLSD